MDATLLAFLAGIIVVGVMLIAVISITHKRPGPLDIDKYRRRWMTIEQQLKRDDAASCHLAVLNADKLLDQALRDRAIKGASMGARMKVVNDTWTNANAVWTAHKLRNKIAHEPDVRVDYNEARHALSSFKQGLKDMGAI